MVQLERGLLRIPRNGIEEQLSKINRNDFCERTRPDQVRGIYPVSYMGPRGDRNTVWDERQYQQLVKFCQYATSEDDGDIAIWLDKAYLGDVTHEPDEWIEHGLEPYARYGMVRLESHRAQWRASEIDRAWLFLEWEFAETSHVIYAMLGSAIRRIDRRERGGSSSAGSAMSLVQKLANKNVWARAKDLKFSYPNDRESITKWLRRNGYFQIYIKEPKLLVWQRGLVPCWDRKRDLYWCRDIYDRMNIMWRVFADKADRVYYALTAISARVVLVDLQGSMLRDKTWHVIGFRISKQHDDTEALTQELLENVSLKVGQSIHYRMMMDIDKNWKGFENVVVHYNYSSEDENEAILTAIQTLSHKLKKNVKTVEDTIEARHKEIEDLIRCSYRHYVVHPITEGPVTVNADPFGPGGDGKVLATPGVFSSGIESQTKHFGGADPRSLAMTRLKTGLLGTLETGWREDEGFIVETRAKDAGDEKIRRLERVQCDVQVKRDIGKIDAYAMVACVLYASADLEKSCSDEDLKEVPRDVLARWSDDGMGWNKRAAMWIQALFERELRRASLREDIFMEDEKENANGMMLESDKISLPRSTIAVTLVSCSMLFGIVMIILAFAIGEFRSSALDTLLASISLFIITGPIIVVKWQHPAYTLMEFISGHLNFRLTRQTTLKLSRDQSEKLIQKRDFRDSAQLYSRRENLCYVGRQGEFSGQILMAPVRVCAIKAAGAQLRFSQLCIPAVEFDGRVSVVTNFSKEAKHKQLHVTPCVVEMTDEEWYSDTPIGRR